MRSIDIDRLLRDERFDELARLSAIPPNRLVPRRTRRERLLGWMRSLLAPARPATGGAVTIRHARAEDAEAIRRLASLDERRLPQGTVLVAEVEETILAALPLDGSPPIADPHRPTAGLVDLLELRSRQLRVDGSRRVAA